MLGQAQYLCIIGWSGILPAWLAKVNARTATPINASVLLGESPLPFLSPCHQHFQFYETIFV
jgi:amino acid transporter